MLLKSAPARRRLARSTNLHWLAAGEDRSAARVKVGGPGGRFEPHIYAQRWKDEAWMTLTFPESRRELQRATFGGNLAEVIAGGDRKHRYFVDDNGDLEYELVLGVKPPSNVFEFQIDFPGKLEFLYQPALNRGVQDGRWTGAVTETEAFAADGRRVTYRPPDIVGSYAVYWHKTNNQYEAGKFCHIKRPKFIDVLGRWTYGELFIDADRKRLLVKCPPRWLDRAMYPVTLDPTIGYFNGGAVGGSDDTTEDFLLAVGFSTATAGDANPGTAFYGGYSSSGTITAYVAIYTHGANAFNKARIAFSSGISLTTGTGAFRSAAITWTGIAASTNYFITTYSDNGTTHTYFDSGSATGFFNGRLTSATPPDPSPNDLGSSGSFNNRVSAYVDYTASGGGRTALNTRAFPLGMYIGMNWRQCNI